MIYVFATAKVRPGCLGQALDCYRELVPSVLEDEPGCLEYAPSLDLDAGLANQQRADDGILVVERWRSIDDFVAHLAMAHCAVFRRKIAPLLVEPIAVRIVRPAI